MLRKNYSFLLSPNIIIDVTKCGENFHKFTKFTHTLSDTKNDYSLLNKLFMVIFQLIAMSTYARKKQQMYSVTQHQFRLRQIWGQFSPIHSEYSLLSVT